MGEARISRGHIVKLLGELGILDADRRMIARCAGVDGAQACPCHFRITGLGEKGDGAKHFCAAAPGVDIDPDDVPPLECPLRKCALVLCLDPVAR